MRQTQHGLPKKTMEKPTGSREKRFAIMRDRCAMHETTQHGRPKIKVNGATRRKRERIKRKAQQRERTKRDKCAMHKTNTAWNNQSRSMVRAITQEQQLDKKRKESGNEGHSQGEGMHARRAQSTESHYEAQASEREDPEAGLVQRDKAAGGRAWQRAEATTRRVKAGRAHRATAEPA